MRLVNALLILAVTAVPASAHDDRAAGPQPPLLNTLHELAQSQPSGIQELVQEYQVSYRQLDTAIAVMPPVAPSESLRIDLMVMPPQLPTIVMRPAHGLIITNWGERVKSSHQVMVYGDTPVVGAVVSWLDVGAGTVPKELQKTRGRALQMVREQRTRGLIFATIIALRLQGRRQATVVATKDEYPGFLDIARGFGVQTRVVPLPSRQKRTLP